MGVNDISTVIFDIGGVVLKHAKTIAPPILAQVYRIPLYEAESAYRDMRNDWQTGKITGREVLERLKRRYKRKNSLDKLEESYMNVYREVSVVNKEIVRLIQILRKHYIVVALSNMVDFHIRFNEKRRLFDHFDKIYISTRVGLAKPDPNFFLYALGDLGKKAAECLFIDDKEKNVETAHLVGMDGFVYTGAGALKKYFSEKGILMR